MAQLVEGPARIGKVPGLSPGLVGAFFPFLVKFGAQQVDPRVEPGSFNSK